MAIEISKEEQEFARFASTTFATWGFENTDKLMKKQMTRKQYIHLMLLLILTQFHGDAQKAWRFVDYALTPDEVKECQQYVVYARQELAKKAGCEQVYLCARKGTFLIPWYERRGYEIYDENPEYSKGQTVAMNKYFEDKE